MNNFNLNVIIIFFKYNNYLSLALGSLAFGSLAFGSGFNGCNDMLSPEAGGISYVAPRRRTLKSTASVPDDTFNALTCTIANPFVVVAETSIKAV